MKIFLGSDHAGFALKMRVLHFLEKQGYEAVDKGDYNENEYDDYPDFIAPVAKEVSGSNGEALGIIFGGSGQGEAIVANRFKGVRAVVYYGYGDTGITEQIIKMSREHNDANILSIGARFVSETEALHAIKLWLDTSFSNDERHIRRIKKIDNLS